MTQIPDAAVQAAANYIALGIDNGSTPRAIAENALNAALPHLPLGFEVKQLEWVSTGQTGFLETEFYAVSGSLMHTVHPVEEEDGGFNEHYAIRREWLDKSIWRLTYYVGNNGFSGIYGNYKSLDEAKAAAQADFERRVRECITLTNEGTKPIDVAALRG